METVLASLIFAHPAVGRTSIFEELRDRATNSKFQPPSSREAPSSKLKNRPERPGICLWGLVFEIWNFSRAWGLVLGVSLLQNRVAPAVRSVGRGHRKDLF